MPRYKHKLGSYSGPVTAELLTVSESERIRAWCGGEMWSAPPMRAVTGIRIKSDDGSLCVRYGEWIVQAGPGRFHRFDAPTFARQFKLVS